jgi:hypothetical protein
MKNKFLTNFCLLGMLFVAQWAFASKIHFNSHYNFLPQENSEATSLSSQLYSLPNDEWFNLKKFGFQNEVYAINNYKNTIEKLHIESATSSTVVVLDYGQKLMTALATDNFIYYAVIDDSNKYSLYRFDPINFEKTKIDGKILNSLYYEKSQKSDYYSEQDLSLEANGSTLFITHRDFVFYQINNYGSTTKEHMVLFDGETTARSASIYIGSFENGTTSYSGLANGEFAVKNEKAFMALYEGTAGKNSKLFSATYSTATGKYEDFQSYNISSYPTKVQQIRKVNNQVYAFVDIWDQEDKTQISRYLYKFLDNGKLEKLGSLGSGKEDDSMSRVIVKDNNLIFKSFNTLYELNSYQNTMSVLYNQTNTDLRYILLETHDNKLIFFKKVINSNTGYLKTVYDFATKNVLPFSATMQLQEGIDEVGDDFYNWTSTDQFTYGYTYVEDQKVLFQLDFTNKTAQSLQFPEIKKHIFVKIIDIQFEPNSKTFWLNVLYNKGSVEVKKHFVYVCE